MKIERIVLGSMDPEMEAIRSLCDRCGVASVVAQSGGRGCIPPTAYLVDVPSLREGDVWVECLPRGLSSGSIAEGGAKRVDHHRPGDPGFGVPVEDAVKASSLGQMAELLGVELTPDERLTAALDHNLGEALHGDVPGIDPDEALKQIAARSPEKPTEEELRATREALLQAPVLELGGVQLRDLRGLPIPEKQADKDVGPLKALPPIASRLGVGYLAPIRTRIGDIDGALKWVIGGWGTAPAVEALLGGALGAGKTYGVPARGFGGIYPSDD